MKVLVTGATGYLGSNLVRRLVASGHQVLMLTRPSSNLDRIADILPYPSHYVIQGTDLSAPFQDNDKIDAVVHTATCYGRGGKSATEIVEANMVFPLRLLETAAYFHTDIFINTDTFFNTDTITYDYLGKYALSKNNFLKWGKLFADEKIIRFINVRIEQIFGPGDSAAKFATQIVRNCLANVPEIKLTPGEQKRDFIYVRDVLDAYEIMLKKTGDCGDFFQQYGLGSGKCVSIREFVESVHRRSGSSSHLFFGGLPYRKNEIMCSVANTDKLRLLGWDCMTSLNDGIDELIRYEKKLQSEAVMADSNER